MDRSSRWILAASALAAVVAGVVFTLATREGPDMDPLGGGGAGGASPAPAPAPVPPRPTPRASGIPEDASTGLPGPGSGPSAPPAKTAGSPEAPAVPLEPGEVRGRAIDARTRSPVAGAEAALADAAGVPLARASSSPSGLFRIQGAPAGSGLVLTVGMAGYEALRKADLATAPGAGLDLGDLLLAPVPAIRGIVFGEGGKPVEGAEASLGREICPRVGVDLDMYEQLKGILSREAVFAKTATTADGSFAFFAGDAPDGEYCLRVSATGVAAAFVHFVALKPGSAEPPILVALGKAAPVSGRIVDPAGVGLQGAFVLAVSEVDEKLAARGRFAFDRLWTESGPDGRFHLGDAALGPLTLIVRMEGYAVQVRAGISAPAEDVTFEMRRGFELKGRVLDNSSGLPVPGATLFARGASFATVQADAEGRFRFENLGLGVCRVVANAPGYSPAGIEADGSAGGVLDRDIRLGKGIRVSGRVVDADTREPLGGASVSALGSGVDPSTGAGVARTETKPDGTFVLEGVQVREDRASDSATRQRPARSRIALAAVKVGWFPDRPCEPDAAPGTDVANVEIVLRRGLPFTGLVMDPRGNPVAGASLLDAWGEGLDRMLIGMLPARASSDAGGRFTLPLEPGRPHAVLVTHPDFAPEALEVPVQAQGAAPPEAVIRLRPGGSIEGQVLDPRGEPAGAVRIEIALLADAGGSRPGRNLADVLRKALSAAVSSADGTFLLDHLPPGTWALTPMTGKTGAAPAENVLVEEGKGTRVVLRTAPLFLLRGVVVDEAGAPLANVRMSVAGVREEHVKRPSVMTAGDGTFRFDGLFEGDYNLHAWSQGFLASRAERVPAGTQDVRIVLRKAFAVSGVIVFEDGSPAARARMIVTVEKGSAPGSHFSNQEGAFKIAGLEPGPVTIAAWANGAQKKDAVTVKAEAGAEGVRIVVARPPGK